MFIISTDGGQPRHVSRESVNWLAWSPDGDRLAMAGQAPDTRPEDFIDQLPIMDVSTLEDH